MTVCAPSKSPSGKSISGSKHSHLPSRQLRHLQLTRDGGLDTPTLRLPDADPQRVTGNGLSVKEVEARLPRWDRLTVPQGQRGRIGPEESCGSPEPADERARPVLTGLTTASPTSPEWVPCWTGLTDC